MSKPWRCPCKKNIRRRVETICSHCKSERSVLALKIGPFRWVKYSPIFESNLAPLNQGQYSPIIARTDLALGWNGPYRGLEKPFDVTLLAQIALSPRPALFWPRDWNRLRLRSNGSRKGWIRHWPAGLNWHFGAETDLFNFQCIFHCTETYRDFKRCAWNEIVCKLICAK